MIPTDNSLAWENLVKTHILLSIHQIYVIPLQREKVEMKRIIYIAIGSLCVGLGTLGIFIPGLPTTPFMLAASWLFYRSSPRMREKLLASWLGVYIRDYEKNKGVTPRVKIMAILMMVVMSTLSITLFIDKLCVRIIVAIACLIGVVVVGFIVPTAKTRV